MKLLLMRHGDALPGFMDDERPLSPLGQQQVNQIGKWLTTHQIPVSVDTIYHSPKLRAIETAKIMQSHLQVESLVLHQAVLPESDPTEWAAHLPQLQGNTCLLVTHLPFIEQLVSYLLTGEPYASHFSVETASIFCLSTVGVSQMGLEWFISPMQLTKSE